MVAAHHVGASADTISGTVATRPWLFDKGPRQDENLLLIPCELPDLSYTLGQDMVGWYSQGSVVDRSDERLGESDKGVILLRRMLKEQMNIVAKGGEPTINVFRDVIDNEWLDTVVHQEDRPAVGQITRASLSGNMGPTHAAIKELEDRFERAALAVAR